MSFVSVTDLYFTVFAIALLFTILVLVLDEANWKQVMIQWFAGISWIAFGFTQFVLADITSIVTITLATLCFGFSVIFILAGIMNTFQLAGKRKVRL